MKMYKNKNRWYLRTKKWPLPGPGQGLATLGYYIKKIKQVHARSRCFTKGGLVI